jgi:membrane protease YdiL (CAAX protease family)
MTAKYLRAGPTVCIVIGLAIGFQLVGAALLLLMAGGSTSDAKPMEILFSNAIAQLVVMLLGTILLVKALGQNPYSVFRLRGIERSPTSLYTLSFPLIVTAQFIGQGLSNLWVQFLSLFPAVFAPLEAYENHSDELMTKIVTATTAWELIVIVVLVGAIPAISEELLFRGFAQTNLERSNEPQRRPFFAICLTAVVFGSIHLSIFKLPGLILLGAALGWMVYRSNNLLLGAFAHGLNNGIITILLFALPATNLEQNAPGLIGTGQQSTFESLALIALFLPIQVFFVFLFSRATSPASDWADHEPSAPSDAISSSTDHDSIDNE